jgi:ELWxxDGT repeat protein
MVLSARTRGGCLAAVLVVLGAAVAVPAIGSDPVATAAPTVPVLTSDVQTNGRGSDLDQLTAVGSSLFFVADDGIHGRELWVTDGTSAPEVIDINPGPAGSNPLELTAIDGTLWFSANDGAAGPEPWTSDGTEAGTAIVSDVNGSTGVGSAPSGFVAFEGDVYFAATTGPTGRELWRSDGTHPGTALVSDILAGSAGSSPLDMTVVDHGNDIRRLWFSAESSALVDGARDLLALDPSGTVTLDTANRQPTELTALGDALYFVAEPVATATPGTETLHRTTLTTVGPPVFTTTSLGGATPSGLTVVGADLLMAAGAGGDRELHRWDGATLGLVADLEPGPGPSFPDRLVASGTTLYFVATTTASGAEVHRWSSADGIEVVEEIGGASTGSDPNDLVAIPGGVLFVATDATFGREPWIAFDTGTVFRLGDVWPGNLIVDVGGFAVLGSTAYLYATTPLHGRELFRVALAPLPTAGASNVVLAVGGDIRTGTATSFPGEAGPAGATRAMFAAEDPVAGREPFVVDPVTGAATRLKDIWPGPNGSDPQPPVALGSISVFSATAPASGDELWRTDGTPAGTVLVRDIRPGAVGSTPFGFTEFNGFLYFQADDGVHGLELWRTDGTAPGTTLVKDIVPGLEGAEPDRFAVMGAHLYFVAQTEDGASLYRTNGTAAGTGPVDPIDEPLGVSELVATGDRLFFVADDPDLSEAAIWVSDGTPAGTAPVDPITAPFAVSPSGLTVDAVGKVFFFAQDGDTGSEAIWVSDGTDAGTIPMFDDPFFARSDEVEPLATGGVAFAGSRPSQGAELWASDGTPGGTDPIIDLNPGAAGAAIDHLELLNGFVYFVGQNQTVGRQLWRTDGASVVQVSGMAGDGFRVPSDIPTFVTAANDQLLFVGERLPEGGEVWRLADVPTAPAAPGSPTAVAGVRSAAVTWPAVSDPTGAPVTAYTVTATPGGATCSTTGALSCTVTALTAGTSYRFSVRAINRIGTSPASPLSNAVVPTAPVTPPPGTPAPMVPVVPARVLETRSGPGETTVDGEFEGVGVRPAGSVLVLRVAGRAGVPVDADAVMLNVTAIGPLGPGFATVWPCGAPQPVASNVNYSAGQVVPNAVLAKVGTNGDVCVFTLAASHFAIDVNGFVPAGGSPSTVVPARVLETRSGPGETTVDGEFEGVGVRPAGSVLVLRVAGRAGVPVDADAVMLNVTAIGPLGPGFATVWPCGAPQPVASNVNYSAGQVVPNAVLAKVGTNGDVCVFTLAASHFAIDVNGFVPAGGSPSTVVPARVLETRSGPGETTVDGEFEGVGVRPAGSVLVLRVAGRAGVPVDADAVMLNVTAIGPLGPGFATVWPCGAPQPVASNVNYSAGQVVPNAVLAKVGTNGDVCVFTLAASHFAIDVNGSI